MIITTACANTMLQTLVPDELRGRVMAFYAFVFVGRAPLGAFLAGLLAEHTSAPFAIAVGGAGCLIAILVTTWRAPEVRKTGTPDAGSGTGLELAPLFRGLPSAVPGTAIRLVLPTPRS